MLKVIPDKITQLGNNAEIVQEAIFGYFNPELYLTRRLVKILFLAKMALF